MDSCAVALAGKQIVVPFVCVAEFTARLCATARDQELETFVAELIRSWDLSKKEEDCVNFRLTMFGGAMWALSLLELLKDRKEN